LISQIAFVAALIGVIITTGEAHIIAFGISVVAALFLWAVLESQLKPVVKQINYTNLGTINGNYLYISRYVSSLVFITVLTAAIIAFIFSIYWLTVPIILMAYLMWFIFLMKVTHDRTSTDSRYAREPRLPTVAVAVPHSQMHDAEEQPRFNHRRRWKGF
jgi:hypothetical protein